MANSGSVSLPVGTGDTIGFNYRIGRQHQWPRIPDDHQLQRAPPVPEPTTLAGPLA